MANHGVEIWRRIFTETVGGIFGGIMAARFVSDDNKKVASLVGFIVGLATTMGLNIFADEKIKDEVHQKDNSKVDVQNSSKSDLAYRTDHAARIKSEPKQKSSLNL